MHEAEVFVVQYLGRLGAFVSIASAIRGAYQLSPQFLLSIGGDVALKMTPRLRFPKTLYVSLACAMAQASFCYFFQRVLANAPGCKWKVSLADWGAVRGTLSPGALFAPARSAEIGKAPYANHKNCFSVETFVDKILGVDLHNSLRGWH